MIEKMPDITTKAGEMETFICHPERNGPSPAVFPVALGRRGLCRCAWHRAENAEKRLVLLADRIEGLISQEHAKGYRAGTSDGEQFKCRKPTNAGRNKFQEIFPRIKVIPRHATPLRRDAKRSTVLSGRSCRGSEPPTFS